MSIKQISCNWLNDDEYWIFTERKDNNEFIYYDYTMNDDDWIVYTNTDDNKTKQDGGMADDGR